MPFVALVAAVPLAWGWGMSWLDLGLMVVMYYLGCHGITIGFHRYFTHGSFKANRPLRIALAIAGSMAVEGPVVRWVADHRRHHKFSDAEGDPHSPWRYGETRSGPDEGPVVGAHGLAVRRGADPAGQVRARPGQGPGDPAGSPGSSVLWTVVSLLLPPLVGGLVTMSW